MTTLLQDMQRLRRRGHTVVAPHDVQTLAALWAFQRNGRGA